MTSKPKKAKIMVVLDMPSEQSDENGEYVESGTSELIRIALSDMFHFDMNDAYFTHVIKCYSKTYPDKVSVDNCVGYISEEIAEVEPKVILAFGDFCYSALTGKSDGITEGRKNVHDYSDVPLIATYHPTYISKANSDKILETFAHDVQRAINIALDIKTDIVFTEHKVCTTFAEIKELVSYVLQTKVCAFDIETSGLSFFYDKINTIAISFQPGFSYVIPLYHKDSVFTAEQSDKIIAYLGKHLFSNPAITKIAHNFKFDAKFFMHKGITFEGYCCDTMVMHHLLDENSKHGLKEIAPNIFPQLRNYEEEVKKYKWDSVPIDILCRYNAIDTDATLRLYYYFLNKLMFEPELYKVFRSQSCPALKLLLDMEFTGSLVDRESIESSIVTVTAKIAELEEEMRRIPQVVKYENSCREYATEQALKTLEDKKSSMEADGKTPYKQYQTLIEKISDIKSGAKSVYAGLNLSSPPQLSNLLYGKYGFAYPKITLRGEEVPTSSTNEKVLNELDDSSGFIAKLLLMREYSKVLSTYLEGIRDRLDGHNVVHPSYLQHGTVTGRLSCKEPNLQNIPRGGEAGSLVKQAFTAPEGMVIMQADYSQAELRLAALFSRDEAMMTAYANGQDLHQLTAMKTMGLSDEKWEALSKDERKSYRTKAKAINFGFIYGMAAAGFKDYAKNSYGAVFSKAESELIRKNFFSLYRSLEQWHNNYKKQAHKNKYVKTLFGRKRRLPDIDSPIPIKSSDAERQAVNSPIQGTAGELTVFAACILKPRLPKGVVLVNTVHDSLIFYVPKGLIEDTAKIIRTVCVNPCTYEYFGFDLDPVGMAVDIEYGERWSSLKEFKFS